MSKTYQTIRNCNYGTDPRTDAVSRSIVRALHLADNDAADEMLTEALEHLDATLEAHAERADAASVEACEDAEKEVADAADRMVIVEAATADEAIRERSGLYEFCGLEHPLLPEACAAYRAAACDRIERDTRAARMMTDAPRGQRALASQWIGTTFRHSAGALGTMQRLTWDEQESLDDAHEAGLAAARKAIGDYDAVRESV